jgi:drug/metabolite transporter (DMT)-like permease
MTNNSSYKSGFIAIFVTMFIWVGFVLSIRAIGKSPLTTADVALLRFGIPALLLLPFFRQRWARLSSVNPVHALMILVGSGLPFFFAASIGGSTTSAAHVGALIPGAAPIFVMVLAYIFYAQKISLWKLFCLLLIAIGVVALLWFDLHNLRNEALTGSIILLGASSLWAVYTLGLRKVGIDAISCTILLCIPSFLILAVLVLCGVLPSNIGKFSLNDAMPFILVQGLGVGVLASMTYSYAIQHIGADKSAVIGSMTPAIASLLAIPILGEIVELTTLVGVFVLTVGVCCSNLKFSFFRRM